MQSLPCGPPVDASTVGSIQETWTSRSTWAVQVSTVTDASGGALDKHSCAERLSTLPLYKPVSIGNHTR